ncbi:MAG: DUF4332 domain-containing protein [Planctomycetaceae bacterium]
MRFTDINIDAFGSLATTSLDDLGGGLNVIYGPNGSGKSTYLQFVRGLFCGFDEARELRLVPPVANGKAGGSLGIQQGQQCYRLSRYPLSDRGDRLAIGVSQGDVPDGERLRTFFETLDAKLMRLQFIVGSPENHAINPLIRIAIKHGVPMQPTRTVSTRWQRTMGELRDERQRVSNGQGSTGKLAGLRKHLARTLGDLQQQDRVVNQWRADYMRQLTQSQGSLQQLEADVIRRSLDWQRVDTDIREAEDRAWRPRPLLAVTRVVARRDDNDRLHQIEQELEHARRVLQDLAKDRMGVSVETAPLLRGDEQLAGPLLQRQRCAVTALEEGLVALRESAYQLEQGRGETCRCQSFSQQVTASVHALQKLTYLLCQDLSRLQQHEQSRRLGERRAGIDRCEAELLAHIQRLHLERESILAASTDADHARLRCVEGLHHVGCRCREHEAVSRRLSDQSQTEHVVEHVAQPAVVDSRLAGWRLRRQELRTALDAAILKWRKARQRNQSGLLQQIVHGERSLAALRMKVERLRREELSLQDEWRTLAVTEAGFRQLQQRSFGESPATVIQEASRMMARLTGGNYPAIEVSAERGEVFVIAATGQPMPVHALSRGTQDQLALSLRLALAEAFAERGYQLPLVFDDLLVDCDRDRLQVAVRLMREAAARGRQIIYFTCQEPLVQLFEEDGTHIRTFPGSVRPASPVRQEFRSARPIAPSTRAESTPLASIVSEPTEFAPLTTAFPFTIPLGPSTTIPASSIPKTAIPILSQSVLGSPLPSHPIAIESKVTGRAEGQGSSQPTRTLPTEPHWLRVDSPVSTLPSISEQMARRLASLHVLVIGDLVLLDLEDAGPQLEALQMTAAQLRVWQSEARMLCCVPDITGRDAQMLVACGILTPQELAESDAEALIRRIDRLRGDRQSGWINAGYVWPDRNSVSRWITSGRRARTFREAAQGAGWVSRNGRSPSTSDPRILDPSLSPQDGVSEDRAGERPLERPAREAFPRQDSERQRVRTERIADLRRRRAERGTRDGHPRQRPEREPRTFTVHHRDGVESQREPRDRNAAGRQFFASLDSAGGTPSTEPRNWRFFLNLESPVVDAPSIGPTTAKRLERAGVVTVLDLLSRDAGQIAQKLQHRRITADTIRLWQSQARLMCRIPELRGHDAQVLVACDICEPEAVAAMSPEALFDIVGPFVATKDGQRLLRSAKTPDLEEVTDWIHWANHARILKVA